MSEEAYKLVYEKDGLFSSFYVSGNWCCTYEIGKETVGREDSLLFIYPPPTEANSYVVELQRLAHSFTAPDQKTCILKGTCSKIIHAHILLAYLGTPQTFSKFWKTYHRGQVEGLTEVFLTPDFTPICVLPSFKTIGDSHA